MNEIETSEKIILDIPPEIMRILLRDQTMSKLGERQNIFWATSDYEYLGPGYDYQSPILLELISGENANLVQPRILKSKEIQKDRSRDKAEVFTPSWVCNAQLNLIDNNWLGYEGAFNTENEDNTWSTNPDKIRFSNGLSWQEYVAETRMEITCGEAPYLVSRYDTTTGKYLPLQNRIGILDRKIRVINENVDDSEEWLKWVEVAYQNVYGYEWQGDNLLLARENLLATFIEYYCNNFGQNPSLDAILKIANIISWNLWQMDGLKCVVPDSCGPKEKEIVSLFGDIEHFVEECQGCSKGSIHLHNGVYCIVRDWSTSEESKKEIRFIDLIKQ